MSFPSAALVFATITQAWASAGHRDRRRHDTRLAPQASLAWCSLRTDRRTSQIPDGSLSHIPFAEERPHTPGQVTATRIPRVKPALPRTSLHGHDNPHARRDGIACGCGDVRAHHLSTMLEAVVCKLLPGDEPHPRYLQHLVASGMRRRRAGSPATTVAMRMSTTKTGPTTSRTGTHCV